jgi:four helix bundle protein
MAFGFEKLIVWQNAVKLTAKIHSLTLTFPKKELFVISSQIKRASDSITLNLAEGSAGQSKSQFSRFLGMSIRSGIEVIACLHIAKERNLLPPERFSELYSETEKVIIQLQALRKSIKTDKQ